MLRLPDRPSEDISSIYYSSGRKDMGPGACPSVVGAGGAGGDQLPTLPRPNFDHHPYHTPASQAENDYFRTWQLQRYPGAAVPAHGGNPGVSMVTPHTPRGVASYPFTRAQTLPNDPGPDAGASGTKYTFQPVEHIYESPKFERRELNYHELDPSSVERTQRDMASRYST